MDEIVVRGIQFTKGASRMRVRSSVITLASAVMGAGFVGIGGCQPPGIGYDWGSFEPSVAHLYGEQAQGKVVEDREKLIKEVRRSENENRKVPPGKYAQIGYLCYLSGERGGAVQYFTAEKNAYPESAKLMDDMIGRMR
jgi:hypothetical protein